MNICPNKFLQLRQKPHLELTDIELRLLLEFLQIEMLEIEEEYLDGEEVQRWFGTYEVIDTIFNKLLDIANVQLSDFAHQKRFLEKMGK